MTNQPEQNTVYWSPNETVTITGNQLASLLQLVDLQTVPLGQVPLMTLAELFAQATKSKEEIMQKLSDEGKLSNTPIDESAEEVEVI
jgi:hypothetical protein